MYLSPNFSNYQFIASLYSLVLLPLPCPIFFWSKSQTSYCFKVRSFQLVYICFSVYMTSIYRLDLSPFHFMFVSSTVWVADRAGMGTRSNFHLWVDIIIPSPQSTVGDTSISVAFTARGLWSFPSFLRHVGLPRRPSRVELPLDTMGHSSMTCNIRLFIPCHSKPWMSVLDVPSYISGSQPGDSEQPGFLINQNKGLRTVSSISKHMQSPSIWHRLCVKFLSFCLHYY